jgi:hypothetical protein
MAACGHLKKKLDSISLVFSPFKVAFIARNTQPTNLHRLGMLKLAQIHPRGLEKY